MLLNYETNKFKILQLILLGQVELLPLIQEKKNFWDRIALKYVIQPLDERQTHEMIQFRLKQVGFTGWEPLFTPDAVKVIYEYTQGCPRRINMLCHDALEILVMRNADRVQKEVIHELIAEEVKIKDGQYPVFR